MLKAGPLDVDNEVDWFIEQFSITGAAEDIDEIAQALQHGLASYQRGVAFGDAVIAALRRRAHQLREAQSHIAAATAPSPIGLD
jgi:hypothetical protein